MDLKLRLSLLSLYLIYHAEIGKCSHLLDTDRAVGGFIRIQDQVLESCKGHFMCEVFPYFNSHGLICLNVALVCDGVPHCRDGSDEIPSVCNQFRPRGKYVTGTTTGTSADVKYVVQKTTPTGGNTKPLTALVESSKVPHVTDRKIQAEVSPAKPLREHGHNFAPLLHNFAGMDGKTPGQQTFPVYLQLAGAQPGLSQTTPPGPPGSRQAFSQFAQYMGMRSDPMTNGLGMWFQTAGNQQNPSVDHLYTQGLQSPPGSSPHVPPHDVAAAVQPHQTPHLDLTNSPHSGHATPPGSSYLDPPVTPPTPPASPDGLIPTPGQEPHLLQEQNFLEQQFYLTNQLDQPAHGSTHQGPAPPVEPGTTGLTDPLHIGNQRQDQLLHQQAMGWDIQHGATDITAGQRYTLSGPFDGGFPTAHGEVSGVNTLPVPEAQSAIHGVEALQ